MAKKRKAAAAAKPADKEAIAETSDAPEGDDVHATALKEYERGYERDRRNQEAAYDDLKFQDPQYQWDDKAKQEREAEGRPILSVDLCGQFKRQVTGDMRQMRPAIKIVPVDDRGDKNVAEKILPGMIRYIEKRSDAQAAYFNAADSQVAAGIGHLRVLTEYAGHDTFNQEIRIAPIDDGVGVVWDPDSILPTREDAQFCFVPVDMSAASFKRRFKDKSSDPLPGAPQLFTTWSSPEDVRVAEYWRKVPSERELALMPDGGIDDVTDDPEAKANAEAQGARVESRPGIKVERYLISASEILEGPDEWPGVHIPIVPFIGEELKVGREIIRRGVIRVLKDVQRIYNYSISTQTEVVALQPKAPFVGTRKNFEKYQDQWETANSKNWPYLEFEPDGANGGQAPQRVSAPVSSSGIAELLEVAKADASAVTGIYPASLGQQGNEQSGKAILARQREGDTGTYGYVDNFTRAVRRTGEIVLDLIPHIYDTKRTMQIVGEDGKIDLLEINQPALSPEDAITPITLNDVTVGAYHIAIEMGPSYSTKREEAREGMETFLQTLGPEGAPMFIDLLAKMQDWPLADKIAKRAQLMLPPAIQQMEAQEAGEEPPPMPPPAPPTPEQQQQAMEAQAQEAEKQRAHDLQTQDNALKEKQIQLNMATLQADLRKLEMKHTETVSQHRAQTAEAMQDPRVDQLVDVVKELANGFNQLRDAVEGISEAVTEVKNTPLPEPPAPPPPPPDHTPRLLELVGQLAARKTPTGTKRTKDGMQLVYEDDAAEQGPAQ